MKSKFGKPGIFAQKRSDLTPDDLEWIRKYDEDRYYNRRRKSRKDMSAEELERAKAWDKKPKTLAEMTSEEVELSRAQKAAYNKQYHAQRPKTDEQKAAKREYDKQRNNLLTPEQKQKRNESSKRSKQKTMTNPDNRYTRLKSIGKFYSIEVSLTFEEYAELISKPCFYCNDEMKTPSFGRGLDRIDNERGYSIDNVLPCCTTCNQTRSDKFTVEETKALIEAVLNVRRNK